jgi:hypothetical protein
MNTYSIQFRMQRVTTEHCFISVPVTSDVLDRQPDGTARINSGRITEQAMKMAEAQEVRWLSESITMQPHPIQRPKEPGE